MRHAVIRLLASLLVVISVLGPSTVHAETSGADTESLVLDSHGPNIGHAGPVYTSMALVDGSSYTITVSGTWSAWSASTWRTWCGDPVESSGGLTGLDAEFFFADPRNDCSRLGHVPNFEIDPGSGFAHLEPIGGIPSSADDGHTYVYEVVGQGQPAGFRILDNPLSDNYGVLLITVQVSEPALAIAGITADLMPFLLPFLDGFEWELDGETIKLVGGMAAGASLGALVCAAAETEILKGGKSKGRHLGTITDTQISLATLCAIIGATVAAEVSDPVADFAELIPPPRERPTGSDDVPGEGNGLDHAPGLQTSADGAGGSGNWPSTALGGDCDDGDIPEDLSHPYDISTRKLTPSQIQDLRVYARLTNSWLAKHGPATIISTKSGLRGAIRAAITTAKGTARDAGLAFPDGTVAGHVPDTAISGEPLPPCGWLAMDPIANSTAGGGLASRVGEVITHITLDGQLP